MPVIDSLVTEVLQPPGGWFWVPMRNLADADRRQRIAEVVSCAPDNVTLLRRIDVAVPGCAWRQQVTKPTPRTATHDARRQCLSPERTHR